MGRNGEPGAAGLAVARSGVELGVGARFARFGTGAGTSNVRMQVGRAQGAKSKISEFSARTKPAGENRRRVHTRKYRPPRAFGLILALSIVKKRRAGRSRRRHRRPVCS